LEEETAGDPLPPFIPTVEAKAERADRQEVGITADDGLEVPYPAPVPTVLTTGSLTTMKGGASPPVEPVEDEERVEDGQAMLVIGVPTLDPRVRQTSGWTAWPPRTAGVTRL